MTELEAFFEEIMLTTTSTTTTTGTRSVAICVQYLV